MLYEPATSNEKFLTKITITHIIINIQIFLCQYIILFHIHLCHNNRSNNSSCINNSSYINSDDSSINCDNNSINCDDSSNSINISNISSRINIGIIYTAIITAITIRFLSLSRNISMT